ncbi:hypothetical protein [Cypionkella sp. TWP1-2-1b2]|uniref:hypothetical protein n=1 Tax=Cypionkella sp. TWP1-2-1b2 TaxID=2804675 RepID=UPI003CF0F204
MFAKTVAAVVLGTALALPAGAGPVVDKAAEIEALMAADNASGAIDAANALLATVWDSSKEIGIHQTVLVTQPAAGYGIYNPRPDEKFKLDEPILIYAEPFGFGYGSGGDGLYTIGFIVDLKVMTEAGEVLGELPSVANLDLTSRYQNREFQANLTYTLSGIVPGRYVLETTLRDKNSEKVGTFQNTIEIIE